MAIRMYMTVLTGIGLTSKMSTVVGPTLVIKVYMIQKVASLVHAVVLHAVVPHVQFSRLQQHAVTSSVYISPIVHGMTMMCPSGQQDGAVKMKKERELNRIMQHRAACRREILNDTVKAVTVSPTPRGY